MKTYLKCLVGVCALFMASKEANAASLVSEINIEGDSVTFELAEAKSGNSLECISDNNSHLWSLPLSDLSSRASYSMLVTAMALEKPINVQSAGNCDVDGVEKAARIWFEKE